MHLFLSHNSIFVHNSILHLHIIYSQVVEGFVQQKRKGWKFQIKKN